jgi:hypothetical protein
MPPQLAEAQQPPAIVERADRFAPATPPELVKTDFRSQFVTDTVEQERKETVAALQRIPSIQVPSGSPMPRTLADLKALEQGQNSGPAHAAGQERVRPYVTDAHYYKGEVIPTMMPDTADLLAGRRPPRFVSLAPEQIN